MVFVLPVKSPGLRKWVIEENPPGPCKAGIHSVENSPALPFLIEAQTQELAQEAARLRSPVGDDVIDRRAAGTEIERVGPAALVSRRIGMNATTSRTAANPRPITMGSRAE